MRDLRFYVWRDDDSGGAVTRYRLPRPKLAGVVVEDLLRAIYAGHARPLQLDPWADMRFVTIKDGTALLVGKVAAVAWNDRDESAARRAVAAAAEVAWGEVDLVDNPKLRAKASEVAVAVGGGS